MKTISKRVYVQSNDVIWSRHNTLKQAKEMRNSLQSKYPQYGFTLELIEHTWDIGDKPSNRYLRHTIAN